MVKTARGRAATPAPPVPLAPTPAKTTKKMKVPMWKKVKPPRKAKAPRMSAPVSKVLTPLRRSSRIQKARTRATSYFDAIPVDVVGTLVKKVFESSSPRDSLKTALAMPREGVAQVIRTIEEGNQSEFNTVGTQAYKQLNLLLRDVGYAVRKLKFEDKLVTKAYAKIVRTHCPNVEVLSVSFSLAFGLWRIPAERCVPGVDTMVEALTSGGKKLPVLQLKLGNLTRSYMRMLVKHVKNVRCLVLDWVSFDDVSNDCFQELWNAVGRDNVAIRKVVLNPPRNLRDERMALGFAREHCPKVDIAIVIDGECVMLSSV